MKNKQKPCISIVDRTKKRIRIHRTTLHLLGDPEYIQLLVNPDSRTIAIRKGNSADPLALRVFPADSMKNCFEIYSSDLMRSLRMIFTEWKEGECCRLYGEMDPKGEVVQFRLDGAEHKEVSA